MMLQGDLMAGEVDKLTDTLTNLRVDIATQFAELKTILSDVAKSKEDHEVRIRVLEQARWKFAGGVAVLSLFGGALSSWIVKVITGG
jgi:hypothetical protein